MPSPRPHGRGLPAGLRLRLRLPPCRTGFRLRLRMFRTGLRLPTFRTGLRLPMGLRVRPSAASGGREGFGGAVGAVLQPAVAVRGQRYGGGRRDAEPVGQVPDQPVEIGGALLRHGDGRAHGGPGPRDGDRDGGGHQQHHDGDTGHRPAHTVPDGPAEMPLGARGEQHDGHGRGRDHHGQRPAADPQQGERSGLCGPRTQLLTHVDTGHGRMSPPLPRDGCSLHHCGTRHRHRNAGGPSAGTLAPHPSWGLGGRHPSGPVVTRWNGFGQSC
ncbi:hypothetical protein GA0115244_10352 [Streptomyces sp. DvalAA-19]|nr:hypothetical protein GA0115244_10352 [Streptomyces sp. DvalAA-19]